ncbi:DNA-binding protein [Salmonella enterica]|nr:DNA-binding protein [Salmonella enterica]EDU8832306.1 DNA-binding protein [Salmonella enterica subsp. enterica]EEM6849383.1 DNA-binding protein [Salmonella enterica subsp. enterica serovar Montevideo]EBP2211656.1 DNA-binding protein [Salmonella enterica]EBP7108620.1 DNA-binding protein [Salmonella enterica]
MKTSKEINQWMTPKQIAELDGMPGTIQGVHKRAKKEGWPKRSQEGRRGPGVEYIPVIPAMQETSIEEMNADTLKMFSLLINKLGENEVREIELNMAKYGLSGLMHERPTISADTLLATLGVDRQTLQTALMLHKLPSETRQEILSKYGIHEQEGLVVPSQEPQDAKKAV